LLAEDPHLDTVTDMSLDVGVGGRRGAARSDRLRAALAEGVEARGVDRILAETFWRSSARPAAPMASVVSIASRSLSASPKPRI
jgi:hypothetical protein